MAHILLLHASIGMGHLRAATALARAFEQVPGVTTQVEDTLDYTRPLFRRFYRGSYLSLADRIPGIWSEFYHATDRVFSPRGFFAAARAQYTAFGMRNLSELVARSRPDAIVCTHFLPVEALAPLRGYGMPPIACVVTDYHAHAFWAVPGADRYFAPTPDARAELIDAGLPAAYVNVSGIPIEPAQPGLVDRLTARRALDIPAWQPIVTLIGSGMAADRVRAIAQAILARRLPATLVIAVGRSRALATQLADLELAAGPALRLLGPQPSLDPLFAASDLVIGKAGGLTVSEVLARGLPMLIPLPVPGQEQWNVEHVLRAGAGRAQAEPGALAADVAELLDNRPLRAAMAAAALAAGRPHAAAAVATQMLDDIRMVRAGAWRWPRATLVASKASVS